MQGNTRSQKPKLALGLKNNITKGKLFNIEEVVDGVDVSIEGSLTVEPLMEVLPITVQLEEENLPFQLGKGVIEESVSKKIL